MYYVSVYLETEISAWTKHSISILRVFFEGKLLLYGYIDVPGSILTLCNTVTKHMPEVCKR